jgi:hypothetical protein
VTPLLKRRCNRRRSVQSGGERVGDEATDGLRLLLVVGAQCASVAMLRKQAEIVVIERSRLIVSLLFQVLLKLLRRLVDADELQSDLAQPIAGCLAQSARKFLRLPRPFLKLWKGLLTRTLLCERFYIVIVVKRDEARS